MKNTQLENQSQRKSIINSNGIVEPYQLVLILCLIISTVSTISLSVSSSQIHIKKLNNYFNSNILGNRWRGLYQIGQNIDEPFTQIVFYQDMKHHFFNLYQTLKNFTTFDGIPKFNNIPKDNIKIIIEYYNQTSQEKSMNLSQFDKYIRKIDFRNLLLNINGMHFQYHFGDNVRVNNLALKLSYQVHSSSMLRVDLLLVFQNNESYGGNRSSSTIRILQQVIAFMLLISYVYNIKKIRESQIILKRDSFKFRAGEIERSQNINISDSDQNRDQSMALEYRHLQALHKNKLYWCYSLIFLNVVTILSSTFSPLSSFLQLLPVFEHHDSGERNTNSYNFNVNLRYAIPYILRILIPVYIFLNGFILYSMLMYPGDYFDDYLKGFFSYMYNNFQVGTYEIFIELKNRGQFAYLLYWILYFYMVLVGNNLVPALFCTLIQMSIRQRDIQQFVSQKVNESACPKCSQRSKRDLQINIASPSLSPFVRPSLIGERRQKITKITIQKDLNYQNKQQFMFFKTNKVQNLSKKILQIINRQHNIIWKQQQQIKINKFIQVNWEQ